MTQRNAVTGVLDDLCHVLGIDRALAHRVVIDDVLRRVEVYIGDQHGVITKRQFSY